MKQTFEQFLQEKHIDERAHLVEKKDLPNDFNYWLCELDADEWIKLGQQWGDQEAEKEMSRVVEMIDR